MRTKKTFVTFAVLMLLGITMLSACQEDNGVSNSTNPEDAALVNSQSESKVDNSAAVEQTYSDPDDISIMLDELKRVRENQWLANQGWWHGQKVLQHQSGNLHGIESEWWFQFSDLQTCPQIMQIIYQENGQVLETSLLISESSLPSEEKTLNTSYQENSILLVKVPDQSCPAILDQTFQHVEQMLNTTASGERGLEFVEAIIQDGYLTITLDQKDDPYRQVLTVTIDLTTGFITGEKNQLYVRDEGEPEGELEYSYTYESFEELPADIQDKFDQVLGKYQ